MVDWRDAILNEFLPGVSKLTPVADPDALSMRNATLTLCDHGL